MRIQLLRVEFGEFRTLLLQLAAGYFGDCGWQMQGVSQEAWQVQEFGSGGRTLCHCCSRHHFIIVYYFFVSSGGRLNHGSQTLPGRLR